jgi:hypothetical protein
LVSCTKQIWQPWSVPSPESFYAQIQVKKVTANGNLLIHDRDLNKTINSLIKATEARGQFFKRIFAPTGKVGA